MALGLARPALALGLLALLLLPGTRSDCGSLPELSGAVPPDRNSIEGFPVGTEVTYRCLGGFTKIPGKIDTVVCLSNSEWSPLEEFCGRSCDVPARLKVAALNQEDEMKSYYPVGITVRYTCRPGYENITEVPGVSTCLENITWSEVPQFCRRKSCGHPGELLHGRAVTVTDFLFGGKVDFLCEDGYELIGQPSIRCRLKGDEVEWSELPTCRKTSRVQLKGEERSGTSTGFNTTSISVVPEQHPKKDISKPYKPSQFQKTPSIITSHRSSFHRDGSWAIDRLLHHCSDLFYHYTLIRTTALSEPKEDLFATKVTWESLEYYPAHLALNI
ncbi:complement decay-accelerating factor-like isoform X2 [Emydura macquarii macquarii]|uniref:complement decay-accelerating factor-like isoform X2 n=1 Tax=Emydura macquarii macquarii TaxID=1129001 RepID=UPI00352A6CC8